MNFMNGVVQETKLFLLLLLTLIYHVLQYTNGNCAMFICLKSCRKSEIYASSVVPHKFHFATAAQRMYKYMERFPSKNLLDR